MTEYAKLVVSVDSTQVGKARTELDKLPASANRAESSVGKMGNTFAKVGGILATAISVREVVRAAEQYTNLTNRLRLVTEGSEQLAFAQASVMRAAQETYQPLEVTAEVYQRIAQNAKKLGLNFADVESITKTVSRTIALSGADTQAASGAMRQFGQALASGSLRGDELNSILEGTPALAQAIARGLGVTTGQLRQMGADGELTADKIIRGLQSQEAEVAALSTTLEVTAAQAATTFFNSLVGVIGKLDEASGASKGFASAVLELSGALDRFSSGEFMDFFRDSKQTAEGFNNEISVTLSRIRDLQDVRRKLDKNDPEDTAFFKFKLYDREEIDAELAQLNGQIDRFQKARDRLIGVGEKSGEETPKGEDSGISVEVSKATKKVIKEAETAARKLDALYSNTETELGRQIELYGQVGEEARLRYELESGSLQGITGQRANYLMDLARELDAKRDLTEQEQIRIDILRESGQLRAANDAQFELEYAEKIAEYERQGNVEALQRLETLRRIREVQMSAAQAPGTVEGVSQAPDGGGIDAAVGGAGSEFIRLQEEAAALEQWRMTELEKQRAFLETKAITEEEYATRIANIHAQHQQEVSEIESARQQVALAGASDLFGNLADVTKQFAGEQSGIYKTMFVAQKAFAIAQSMIAIQQGIALAAANPFPLNLAAMASVAAATAGLVSNISSVAMSFEGGGFTGSGPRTGGLDGKGGFMAMVHPNETIIDHTKQGGGKSGGGGLNMTVNLIEDASKAGTVEKTQSDDGSWNVNAFVADLYSDGPAAKAISQKFGVQGVGR
ncbi:tape measure protein [Pseudomonas sp. NPDC077408]|uniref:tape measure protein n=1 Tax=Streptomyces parvus TaxID=66428 RepID=UPI00371E784B